MKKDAFYFPHFCNARHDRKIRRMEKELGLESYAIYFKLLEILREQMDFKYPLEDLDLLADEIGTSEQKIKVVISNYELFVFDEGGKFFSIKQIYYLQPYIEKTERARLAAKKRWSNINDDANAMQMQCVGNASKGKESKVKESKVYKVSNPLLNQVIDYFIEKGSTSERAKKAFEYYEAGNWTDSKGNKVKNWKQKMLANWINNNNFTKTTTNDKLEVYKSKFDNIVNSEWAREIDSQIQQRKENI
jgi:hypothetical protein